MRYDAIDQKVFIKNRNRLTSLLSAESIAVLHSNDVMPTNADGVMPFKQNSDLFHQTGIDQEESILLLFPDASNPQQREVLFIKETNDHIAVWEGKKLTKEEAREVSGVANVQWLDAFESVFHALVQQAQCIYLNRNEHTRADSVVETRNDRFIKKCKAEYPLYQFERLAPCMHQIRACKEPEEVALIEKACAITEVGFRRALQMIAPGVGEWEVEAEFSYAFLQSKSRGFAYLPIIGGGAANCVLHYIDNDQRLESGDLVLMDVGAEYANWNADMTRTVPVNGTFTPRQREVYEAVLRVMRAAVEMIRPGLSPLQYQQRVLEKMEQELIGLGLISAEEAAAQEATKPLVKKYFMHGASHHLGLDVHDVAPMHESFAVGNVLTVEPGIYIPEEKIGVRLENNIVIGEEGNRDLMANIPIEPDEIESLMKK